MLKAESGKMTSEIAEGEEMRKEVLGRGRKERRKSDSVNMQRLKEEERKCKLGKGIN